MNGAQFAWLAVLAFFAWIVFQVALESSARKERIRLAESISDKTRGWRVAMEKLESEIAADETRRATIAQASY